MIRRSFGTPSCAQILLDRSMLNFHEHVEDLEHDQTRYQAIHDLGRGDDCYDHWETPGSRKKSVLYIYNCANCRYPGSEEEEPFMTYRNKVRLVFSRHENGASLPGLEDSEKRENRDVLE